MGFRSGQAEFRMQGQAKTNTPHTAGRPVGTEAGSTRKRRNVFFHLDAVPQSNTRGDWESLGSDNTKNLLCRRSNCQQLAQAPCCCATSISTAHGNLSVSLSVLLYRSSYASCWRLLCERHSLLYSSLATTPHQPPSPPSSPASTLPTHALPALFLSTATMHRQDQEAAKPPETARPQQHCPPSPPLRFVLWWNLKVDATRARAGTIKITRLVNESEVITGSLAS